MIDFAVYAHGDFRVASTRLRSHYLFLSALNYGYRTFYEDNFLSSFSRDILYLQMVYKPKHIIQAVIFRFLGKKVIFDIDDAAVFFKHKLAMFVLSNIASHVTVDTFARKGFWDSQIFFGSPQVIRDSLDIDPAKNNKFVTRNLDSGGGILWIGNRENLHSIEPLLAIEAIQAERKIYIASNFGAEDPIKTKYKNINFLDWELDISYDKENIDATFMILNHSSHLDDHAKYKSENKMVTAIASGLIPIISNSPAYSELAQTLNGSRLIFNSMDEIPKILNDLDENWMKNFLINSQMYISKQYSNEKIFNDLRASVLEINSQ
ncbi:hypothetical protein OAB45_05330 [Gammaproteobacteria bacterium]|nr:hypothetical protein [Gammaproteobacteria bacterium]